MVSIPRQSVRLWKTDINGKISGQFEELSQVTNVEIIEGIDRVKDNFSFEIPIYQDKDNNWKNRPGEFTFGDKVIRFNDVVAVFASRGENVTFTDDNLLIMGVVRKWNMVSSQSKIRLKVSCINRTEELLRGMAPYTTVTSTTTEKPVTTIIKEIMERVNKQNPNHKVQVFLDTETIGATGTSGGIQSKKSDGTTTFPNVTYNATWKPAYLQLEQLSSPDITDDKSAGNYLFFVKPVAVKSEKQAQFGPYTDVLFWQNANTTTVNEMLVEGSQVINYTADYDIRDIVNAVIVNAGPDINQNGILGVAFDLESMGKYGTKWGHYTKSQKKFSQLHNNEVLQGNAAGIVYTENGNYPEASAYPYTMYYDGSSVADDEGEFNTNLRNKAREEAVNEATDHIRFLKFPRYLLTFDLPLGSNTFTMGNIHPFKIPSLGWDDTVANPVKKLRLRQQQHILSNGGWQTRITAKEDEAILTGDS